MIRRRASRGSLLIITLWLVTILGALSVAVARYLSTEVRLTRYRLARHEARELARSGVYLALTVIQQDPTPTEDWSGEPWAAPQAVSPASGQRLTVTITDEERKLNVNTATSTQLSSLLGDDTLAQAIVDYVDAPDPTEDRLTDNPPYYAKNSSITVLDELNDVPGMETESYETLTSFTTPFTPPTAAGGPLNLNTVMPEVLEAVGVPSATVQTIVQYRSGAEHFVQAGAALIALLESQGLVLDDAQRTLLASALFTVGSQLFLVVSEGVLESPNVRVRVQAVIQRSTDTSPPKIISWRESSNR